MKTKKYHFGKRWALIDPKGEFLTNFPGEKDKDIINARIFRTKSQVMAFVNFYPREKLEVVCIKETVYVVEV